MTKNTLLFNGTETVLHFHQGNFGGDLFIITFVGLSHEYEAENNYFLKPVAEKIGYSCLGITTKIPNWYLSDEMKDVIAICNEITRGKRIVIFGQSMGAYAAIKYSAALNAKYVLALAPKFSIHPDDIEIDQFYHKYLTEKMKGMATQKEDTGGDIYICYDPAYTSDKIQAEETARRCHSPYLIPVFYSGHVVIQSLMGTKDISLILNSFLECDRQTVTNTLIRNINAVRRKSINNLTDKFHKSLSKHSVLTCKALLSPTFIRVNKFQILLKDYEFIAKLLYKLIVTNQMHLAYNLINSQNCFNLIGVFSCTDPAWNISTENGILISFHRKQLYYDLFDKCFRLGKLLLPPEHMLPVGIRYVNEVPYLCVQSGNRSFGIIMEENRAVLCKQIEEGNINVEKRNSTISASFNGKYLRAIPNGAACFDANGVNDWEIFAFIAN